MLGMKCRAYGRACVIYLSADVGGTFTDLVLIDSIRGRTLVEKLPSGRRASAESIATGIERITGEAGIAPGDLDLFVHGFTVATNAFLMRKGARAALLVTAGFRDILEIGSQQRPRLYPLRQQKPAPRGPGWWRWPSVSMPSAPLSSRCWRRRSPGSSPISTRSSPRRSPSASISPSSTT